MSEVNSGPVQQAAQLMSESRFDQAEDQLRSILAEQPDNDAVMVLIGLCRNAQNDPQGALAQFDRAIEINPEHHLGHYYRGRILSNSGDLDGARASISKALEFNPNFAEGLTILGVISMQQDELDQAATELKTALRADENFVPAMSALGRVLALRGDLEEAEKMAARAIQLSPENAAAQDAMAFVFIRQGRLDFAEQCLRNALDKQPDNGELHSSLGTLLMSRGRHRSALPHFQQAMRQNAGGLKTRLNTASSLSAVGDQQQAWQILEQAYQRWPDEPDLRLRLADLRLLAGQGERVPELIDGLDPERLDVQMIQARIHHVQGDIDRAMNLLDGLMDELSGQDPISEDERRIRLLKLDLAGQNGLLEPAQAAIEPLLQLSPPDVESVQAWTRACRRLDRLDLAIEPVERVLKETTFEQTTSARNDQARLHQILAELNHRLGRYDDALPHLGRSAWRPIQIDSLLQQQAESQLLEQWQQAPLDELQADSMNPDGAHPEVPLAIVLGWPGSGREAMLSALMEATDQLRMLEPNQARQRREALGLPLAPDVLSAMSEDQLSAIRNQYLGGLPPGNPGQIVLDTAWYEMSALPVLARLFPGLLVIWPEFDPRDLELHFRFSGFQSVSVLSEQLRAEQALADRFFKALPVDVLRIQRQALFDAPGELIGRLCKRLGIEAVPAVQARLERARDTKGFLPADQWKHYEPLFESTKA